MPRRKPLLILFVTLLIDMIGVGMVIPIIPVLFTDPTSPAFLLHGYSRDAQFVLAGLVTALFGLMQFLAAPILGELSDVYGRKKLLTLGVGVLAVSQLLFGFGIELGWLWLLLVSRMVAGLAGANFAIAQASIADVTEPKDRAKNFGLIGAAFGIGFILGPLLGGWLTTVFGNPAASFWVAAGMGICNMLSITFFLPETHVDRKAEHTFHPLKGIHNILTAWRDKDAKPLFLASFLYFSGFTFFTSFIGILLVDRFGLSEGAIGGFFGLVGAWVALTQIFILRWVTRHATEHSLLRVTLPLLALGIGLYPFVSPLTWLYAIIPLVAIPNGLSMANMSALVSKSVSADKQGAALGINGSLMALSQGTIPLLAGLFTGWLGVEAPFLVGSTLVVSAWSILFFGSSRGGKR